MLHVWKAYLTLEIVKQDKCPIYIRSSKLLFPTYYCVQHITVSNTLLCQLIPLSSKILCPHLFLIYTCSTFPCQHAVVVSCFTLCSTLFYVIIFMYSLLTSKNWINYSLSLYFFLLFWNSWVCYASQVLIMHSKISFEIKLV